MLMVEKVEGGWDPSGAGEEGGGVGKGDRWGRSYCLGVKRFCVARALSKSPFFI